MRLMRSELTRFPLVKTLLKNRWPQLLVWFVMLAGFLFAILSGFFGTPVGNRNFGIVFVWIAWWAVLILVAVPFFGRGWCAVCPIPLPGEWLQRGAIMDPPGKKPRWFNLRWPNRLRNIWLQNLTFTLVALFSSVILTTPKVTAIVLSAMLFLAIGMSIVFERRTFCRYLCPVGGFIGLYAQAAPMELRVKDKQTCLACKDKPCYNGSPAGYGCPWDVFPGGLMKNTYCGLCMECLRTCPYDNIAINTRPFSADLAKPSTRMDEAFKAFIMLGAAMIYAGVFLGPWGGLKLAAYSVGSLAWFGYTAAFLAFTFGLLPALFLGAVWIGKALTKTTLALKKAFTAFATALVPLGLMFWVAFSLSFVLTNAAYILSSLSDPFGWGWNLFGTAAITWQPYLTPLLLPLQTLVLVGGLLWTGRTAQKAGLEVKISPVPVIVFSTVTTIAMLGLLL
ncbi:MAG: 4Fe-4S binding protein [Chloroflexi bacterium]|nr:4Fe-4S binding protein [Chloroflexota bacterium]